MRHGTVAAQVAIPPVVFLVQTHLGQAGIQHVQTLFTLGATDDLADARGQYVHGGNCLAVVVETHVEGLDVFRVVLHHHRRLEVLLGQIALVLGGEIDTPGDRELELLAAVFQHFDGVGVVNLGEVGGNEALQTADGVLVNVLSEELQIVATLGQYGVEDILQHGFGQGGVIFQIVERHFRLDHPELGQVTAGVGVFGAEGRPEGVDLGEGAGIGFGVQLAGYGQEGLFAEEIFVVVHLACVGTRQVFQIQGGDAEHLAGTFGVGGGDERRGNPDEALLVEEAVDGLCQAVAHPGHSANDVGARTQVGLLAQVLDAVALGGHRVGVRVFDPADHLDLGGLQLERLAAALGFGNDAGHFHGAGGGQTQHFILVIGQGIGDDGLYRMETGAIGNGQKWDPRLGITASPDPPSYSQGGANRMFTGQHIYYGCVRHRNIVSSLFLQRYLQH